MRVAGVAVEHARPGGGRGVGPAEQPQRGRDAEPRVGLGPRRRAQRRAKVVERARAVGCGQAQVAQSEAGGGAGGAAGGEAQGALVLAAGAGSVAARARDRAGRDRHHVLTRIRRRGARDSRRRLLQRPGPGPALWRDARGRRVERGLAAQEQRAVAPRLRPEVGGRVVGRALGDDAQKLRDFALERGGE